MFTDMVGYTSLTQADEDSTMRLLEEHRNKLRPIFSRFGGREVKTIGDAFLVEFASSLEAVRCAVEIQNQMRADASSRVKLRIGIHAGEVIHSGGDIYGDAVNIASRIEPLAAPGEIRVSRQIYELAQNKVNASFVRTGSVELKNIRQPMEIYKVLLPQEEVSPAPSASLKRRVAVLPFDNFSPDRGDEYFADGLTEEMIGTLSKIRELNVISRTSVMQYKGRPKLIPEISRELNAGTILEGSVRKAGNRARVSVQLIDAVEDRHVWAENYDRELQDIFAVQSDIATKVAEALKVEILEGEKEAISEAPTKNPEANLLYLKGVYQGDKGTPADILKAVEYFELAVEQDPRFALAYSSITSYLVGAAGEGISAGEALPRAKWALGRAMDIDPELAETHSAKGWLAFQLEWDWVEAERNFKEAIALNPNLSIAHDWYGRMLSSLGRYDQAISEMRRACELDPGSPWAKVRFGVVYWEAGMYKEARSTFQGVLEKHPNFVRGMFGVAYVDATEGKPEAAAEVDAAVELADQTYFRTHQAVIHAMVGSKVKAKEILEGVVGGKYKGYADTFWVGAIFYLLGDMEAGYKWVKKAFDAREPSIPFYCRWPAIKALRSDPRYLDMLRQINLT